MNLPEFVETVTIGNVITWLAFLGSVYVVIRRIAPVLKKLSDTLDDIKGEPARPGVPARLGIMERMEKQDLMTVDIRKKLEHMDNNAVNTAKEIQRLSTVQHRNVRNVDKTNRQVKRVEAMLIQHVHDSKIWIADLARNAEHYNFKVPDWPVRPSEPFDPEDDDDEDDDPSSVGM